MKPLLLFSLLLSCVLAPVSPAQTCREVVRDASGRVVQTIDHQKQAGGTERAVIRDATGRITGTATTSRSSGSFRRTDFRDASSRSAGSETTHSNGSMTTTRRDSSGRVTGNSTGTGKCRGVVRVPTPPAGAKK